MLGDTNNAVAAMLLPIVLQLAHTLKLRHGASAWRRPRAPAVLFILGAFILAAAMAHSGLSERLALVFLNAMGGSPQRLTLGILLGAAFLSFWMP